MTSKDQTAIESQTTGMSEVNASARMTLIERLLRWLRLADYDDAKREATLRTIADVGRD